MRCAFIASLVVCIFIADTVTDFEIAFAVFYIAVILIAMGFLSTRVVVALASVCIALTVLSLFLTRHGSFEAGLFNCCISSCAITVTTYLSIKATAAQAAAFEVQEQLERMARVTRLGELTASIAHEVNQPLAAVVTSADACRRWLEHMPPNVDRARQAAVRIVGDAKRASDVVARVRRLATSEQPQRERVDVNDAVADALEVAEQAIERNHVVLKLDLSEDLPSVMADRIQIQQVIGNLLLNAIEAMAEVPSFKRELIVASSRDEIGSVVVAVTDSGSGMKQTTIDHLFDAFWTTKKSGMGIGLTISRAIIEAHTGHISVTSAPRMGTTVQFTLPAAGEEA